jgi:hypothetical protein
MSIDFDSFFLYKNETAELFKTKSTVRHELCL